MLNKDLIEQYNRVNNFVGGLDNVVDTTTMHLVIVKYSFHILISTGKLSDSQEQVERLNVVNNAVENICNDLILDRTRIKNFFLKKLDHHFNKDISALFTYGNLASMSSDYGEINKELDFSSISTPLTVILKDIL